MSRIAVPQGVRVGDEVAFTRVMLHEILHGSNAIWSVPGGFRIKEVRGRAIHAVVVAQ
jgi:hypothetical protein